jgi:hypothetical protein
VQGLRVKGNPHPSLSLEGRGLKVRVEGFKRDEERKI